MRKKPKATQNKAEDVEGVKMELSIKDRLTMMNSLMPKEGDIISLTISRDVRAKLELSQAEIKRIGLESTEGGGLKWKEDSTKKKVKFTNAEMEILRTQVNDLDKRKKITSELLSVCLMIRK